MAAEKKKKRDGGRPREAGIMGSVLKTFEVLDVFERKWRPLSVTELCQETGRPKSSLHRILSTLVRAGVLEQNERGQYRLTLKLWRIGVLALAEIDIVQIARAHLEALSRAADETVHLAVLEPDGDIVYLSKVESPRSIRVQTRIGKVTPSWCTATGRALLAYDAEIRERVLAAPKEKFTPFTETDPDRLRRILERAARDGFAVAKAENHPEMGGVAAPIHDHTGAVVASCGIAVPAFRMDEALIERCTALVLKTAADISAELSYRPASRGGQLARLAAGQ
jgi:DNA-binding IclR family transcriptional regulator